MPHADLRQIGARPSGRIDVVLQLISSALTILVPVSERLIILTLTLTLPNEIKPPT